ncbi:MAG: SPOR domain-containing protein [Gammaproteobacteria bacterium]|nr:SPOR domain-containing protein [Gammaproteobacteria bacterium]
MKEPTPTKKELAAQYRALDEQINRLKNRLNGEVFKKTKHGYRLNQLSEGARGLQRRIEQIESNIRQLALQDRTLLQETESLREKSGGKKRLKTLLNQLGSDVEGLRQQQRQLTQTLQNSGQLATQIADLRDDLRRESDDLKTQVRNLEESSSRESVAQEAQQDRIQSLETALAELTNAQQRLGEAAKAEQTSLQRELDDAVLPMQAALRQIEEQSAGDTVRLEEIEQQIGSLQQQQQTIDDLADRLERGQEQQQLEKARQNQQGDLDSRIGELERRSQELQANWQEIERKRQQQLAEQQARFASRDQLDDNVNSLHAELGRIDQQRAQERGRLDGFEHQLAALRDTLEARQNPTEQLSRIESLQREFQQRLGSLEQHATSSPMEHAEEKVQQLTESWSPDLGDRLTSLESELGRLNEAEEFLQKSFRDLGGVELALNGRLDALQRDLEQQRGDAKSLQQRLEQLGETLTRDRQQLRAEIGETRQATGEPQAELAGNLDRLEQAAVVDRERIAQLESGLASARDEVELQRRELNDKLDVGAAVAEQQARLDSELSQQKLQQQAQTELAENQAEQLSALSQQLQSQLQKGVTLSEAQQHIATLVDQQDEERQVLQTRLQEQEQLLQEVRQWTNDQAELQQQISSTVQASKGSLDELRELELNSDAKITGIEQAQQLLQQQQQNDAPLIEENKRTLELVEKRLEGIGDSQEKQQRRMDRSDARGRSNRVALAALLLLGILGGLAIYFASAAKIAEVEQRTTRQMLTPDSRYATSERLTESLRSVELAQGEIQRKIENLQNEAPSTRLRERQSDLELRLARLEVKLNLVSAGADPAQDQELTKIQSDIEGLHGQVSTAANTIAASDSAVQVLDMRLDELSEAIDERLARLETASRQMAAANVEKTTVPATNTAEFNNRIAALEAVSTDAMQAQKMLSAQVDELARALSALERKVTVEGSQNSADRWRSAGEIHRYTIQLAGSRKLDSLRRFANQQLPSGEHAFYLTNYQGKAWNILLYGIFDRLSEAKAALNSLPQGLRRYRPWIRVIPGDYTYLD